MLYDYVYLPSNQIFCPKVFCNKICLGQDQTLQTWQIKVSKRVEMDGLSNTFSTRTVRFIYSFKDKAHA